MSKKNVFVSNNKEITMGKGNLQLNTSAEQFRDKVQLFADGINAMNDKALYYSDCVKTATRSLELYLKGTYTDSTVIEQKEQEIESFREASRAIRAEIAEKMPEYDDTDKNLYYAYRQYIDGDIEVSVYHRAMAEWLDNGGIVPTDKGIKFITDKIGVKKASAKTMCKNGGTQFTVAMSEKQYLDLVYRTIATLMYKVNALKKFEYEYVIPTKAKAETTQA